jgi:hypothetical protein
MEYNKQTVLWTDMIKCCLLHNHENTIHGLQKILLCITDIVFLNIFNPNETAERDMQEEIHICLSKSG